LAAVQFAFRMRLALLAMFFLVAVLVS